MRGRDVIQSRQKKQRGYFSSQIKFKTKIKIKLCSDSLFDDTQVEFTPILSISEAHASGG